MSSEHQSFVMATAGHVDHGKSALIRALTGTEPDRWDEERTRGLTIDLGFAHTTLPSGRGVSFVDVPGHERFIDNMLAGLGPVGAVCLVVAADDGWSVQSSEHRDAIRAFDINTGVVALTKTDLVDATRIGEVRAEISRELADTGLAEAPTVAVSALTGDGLDDLRSALDNALATAPQPDLAAPVRLWIDRSFSIKGAGTVITGTLLTGQLSVGDELILHDQDGNARAVTIRGLQSHGASHQSLTPARRVAVNLRGIDHDAIARGDALLTPKAWWPTQTLDVAAQHGADISALPQQIRLHLGTAAVTAHLRALSPSLARLSLSRPLPMHINDVLVVHGTGTTQVLGGVRVLALNPPEFRRRGAAAARAEELHNLDETGQLFLGLQPKGWAETKQLRAQGFAVPAEAEPESEILPGLKRVGGWVFTADRWEKWLTGLKSITAAYHRDHPMQPGVPARAAVQELALPGPDIVTALVKAAGLREDRGVIADPTHEPNLETAEPAVNVLIEELKADPFNAPDADRLDELGLGPDVLAAAHRQNKLLRLADGVVVLPLTPAMAMKKLAALPQPFTASDARHALGTTRRTLIPLLEHLDARGWTRREGNHRWVK